MKPETITWRAAATDPPSDDTTVLVSVAGASEPVWVSWLDDGVWRDVSSGGELAGTVVSWADVPEGWFPSLAA